MAVLKGTAYWASITVPNTNYEPQYTVNLVVPQEVADDFESRGFTVKQMEEGPALIIRRKVLKKNGQASKVPVLLDKAKNPLDVAVGNGSVVRVQYDEWETVYKGKDFKGLDLKGVQVLDLVHAGIPDGAEFDDESGSEDFEDEL
jgi:hypothetical protein